MDQSRTIVWVEELEQLTLELSPQHQKPTTGQEDHAIKRTNQNDGQHQSALNKSWVRSPLGFVKKKEETVDTQECLGREWVRGPLGYKLYTCKE